MSDGTREQLFLVTMSIAAVDLGTWDKWDGGDEASEENKYRSGGQPYQEDLGGAITISDITITRNYRLSRDAPIMGFMRSQIGVGNCIANKYVLNRDYSVYGPYTQAQGPMRQLTDPKVDSNAANPALVAVVMGVNSLHDY